MHLGQVWSHAQHVPERRYCRIEVSLLLIKQTQVVVGARRVRIQLDRAQKTRFGLRPIAAARNKPRPGCCETAA